MGAGFSAYRSKLDPKLQGMGLDPMLILTILQILQPLITAWCTPKGMRRRLGNRARLAIAIMNGAQSRDIDMDFEDAFKIADAHFDLADEATDAELQDFRNDCCS